MSDGTINPKRKTGRPKNPLTKPRPIGRPKIKLGTDSLPTKEINFDQVMYWIELQATAEEIASSFRVSVDTLDMRLKEKYGINFTELKKRTDGTGKLALRRNQFKQSETNSSMAIWLGKNWLGQKDEFIQEVKELVINELRSGIKQLSEESRSKITSQPSLAIEQLISDSGQRRELDQVQAQSSSDGSL